MNLKPFLYLFVLSLVYLTACNKGSECTDEFRMYMVKLNDQDGEPLMLDFHLRIRDRDNDTMTAFDEMPNTPNNHYLVLKDFTAYPERSDLIIDHNHVSELYNKVDSFTFIGEINDSIVISSKYLFSSDGCHIFKVEGESEIIVDL